MHRAISFVCLLLAVYTLSAQGLRPHQDGLRKGLKYRGLSSSSADSAGPAEMWMSQPLDHFNPGNTATWNQRYFMNDTYWKPAGPIFILLGGEGPIDPIDVQGHFILNTYAEQFGALIISVEHRFYGKSMPTKDLSVDSLKYLTTSQALADYANFRQYITTKLNATQSTWISFGGSYSGSLSAWYRMKYPTLIAGAIAASAPVQAKLDFSEYLEVVQQSIGPECAERVLNVTKMVSLMIGSATGRSQLQALFNTCDPIVSDEDKATFMSSLTDAIAEVVQYNNDNRAAYTNIPKMCAVLLNGTTPAEQLASYAKFNNDFNAAYGSTCTDASYKSMVSQMRDTDPNSDVAAARSWTWQTCIEFGYFQTAESAKQPFSYLITLQWYINQCVDIFGPEFASPNTKWINTDYGSNAIRASNIVFPNGSIDPWHVLGVLEANIASEVSVLITGTAHCADLYAPSPNDLPALTSARQTEVQQIQKWLSGDQC